MIYSYRCRDCGLSRDSQSREDVRPCSCGGLSKRDYRNVQFGATGLVPHYNHAVGAYVSSNREFDDVLKRREEANTLVTGAEHKYVRVDPGDIPEPAKDTAILETRARTIHDKQIREESLRALPK